MINYDPDGKPPAPVQSFGLNQLTLMRSLLKVLW